MDFVGALSCSTSSGPPRPHPSSVTSFSKDDPFSYEFCHKQPHEFLRARELLRYYSPPQTPSLPSTTPSSSVHSAQPESLIDLSAPAPILVQDAQVGGQKSLLKSSDDPALLAFSQLLALRLDCERSMISLIDRKNQFIIAEATRTLPITHPMQKSGLLIPDGLWMGCQTIPAEDGLCINTIQLGPEDEDGANDASILEISDLTLDPRFRNCDYVLNYPHLRFYAATPLRTKRGYNIGSLCVVDSSPRILNADEKQMLGQMGKVVMRQLEMTAERKELLQNKRMVEILGHFFSGNHMMDGNGNGNGSSFPSQYSTGTRDNGGSQEQESPSVASPSEVPGGTLRETFSRASALIRDALMTDGVLFLDADKVYDMIVGLKGAACRTNATHPQFWACRILGRSGGMSWDDDYEFREGMGESASVWARDHGKVPDDSIIQRMLQLYPLGTILSFDQPTTPPTSDPVDGYSSSGSPSTSEENQIFRAVQNFLPECASVLFVPLCHSGGKPYAASFSWTYDIRRVFTSDEVICMQSFMKSINSELDRISADKIKGDFIASISHELRSPLHGVLLSAELLAETSLDAFQHSFLDTVENCGRMLLDTINHVLDFQKLTNLLHDRNAQPDTSLPGHVGPSYDAVVSRIESTDISILTEQVVEGVCAGYEFKGITSPEFLDVDAVTAAKSSSRGDIGLLSNYSGLSNMRGDFQHAPEAVTVILDIEQRDNWTFLTQAGAIRRILMNIFANALKYTDTGWVRVGLKAEDLSLTSDDNNGKHMSKVTLSVSDSGRGISGEFLKAKLFTPFTQEDTLTHGTGLGLSIVREIVRLLGGDIQVQSQVDVGTEITVTLVLERSVKVAEVSDGHMGQLESALISQLRKHSVGKTICLTGVDTEADSVDSGTQPITEATSKHVLTSLGESLVRYAQAWFGMHVVTGTLATEAVDIFLANESANLVRYLEGQPNLEGQPDEMIRLRRPLIVLCSNVSQYRGYVRQATNFHVLQFVSKPCGPIKLAKALLFCFERSHQLDVVGRSLASQPKLLNELAQRHQLPPLLPKQPTPAVTGQVTVVIDDLNIQAIGFVTSSITRSSTPPVAMLSAVGKPLGPMPNVLIVDDNPINLMVLAAFFHKKKCPFTKAVNGLLGVQAVMASPETFDVILMDMQMPVMSGFEAIRAIRKFEAENIGTMKRSLIIALTGLASSDDTDEAYDAGADLFLTKPVSFKIVNRELEKWMGQMGQPLS